MLPTIKALYALLITVLCTSHIYAQSSKAHLFYNTVSGSISIKTWKDLRDNCIEKQDADYSCGSAATATILRYFYGKDVYEKDILEVVIDVGDDGTASFSDLEQAVKRFGFKAVGLTLSFDRLKHIQIPAIAYLRYRDNDHFSVIRGINEQGTVWLGDPSWGNRKFSESRFRQMWETRAHDHLKGKILLIIPEDKDVAHLNKDFFGSPKINSTAVELLTLRR